MAQFPSMPLFTDAIMADCYHLDDSEFGRYMRLLILMWRTPNCQIPDDPAWICKRLKLDALAYAEHVQPIMQEFCTLESGVWFQKRLRKEYQYVTEKVEKRRKAAQARWGTDNKKKKGMQMHKQVDKQKGTNADAPTPTPTPTDISLPKGNESCHPRDVTYETKAGTFMSWAQVVDFLWKEYPRVGRRIRHKNKMEDELIRILQKEGKNAADWKQSIRAIAEGIRRYRAYSEESGEISADPFRWLKSGGYKDDYTYSQAPDRGKGAGPRESAGSVNQIVDAAEKAKEMLR